MPPVVNRSVFYGFGAWVGQQTGSTSCNWWPQDPSTLNPPFDTSKYIGNDLANNPYAVVSSGLPLGSLQVDNAPPNGGLTKIGASFPGGSTLNSCWLEKGVYDALATNVKPPRLPTGVECRTYELETVYYWPGTGHALATHRYWGFYAQIDSENGQNALVSIWPAGKSLARGQTPAGSWWLNLSNTSVAHPVETGFTVIGTGLNPKQGALFLDSSTVGSLSLSGPKLPPSCGDEPMGESK
jgi:hypothetical protein